MFRILTSFFLVATIAIGFGQVNITNTSSTPSTCPNNGSITVDATQATGSALLYSIVSGPMTQSQQSSNTFNSLEAGTYEVQVEDLFGNVDNTTVTISGSYQELSFVPSIESPISCSGQSDAVIEGNLNFFTGLAPYTWEIIAPAASVTAPQSSDRFENLGVGVYTIRVNDACNEFETRNVQISEDIGGYTLSSKSSLAFKSCTEAELNISLLVDSYSPPFTIETRINNSPGTTTIVDEDYYESFSYLSIELQIENISYGDDLELVLRDACNRSYVIFDGTEPVADFFFCASSTVTKGSCTEQLNGTISPSSGTCEPDPSIFTSFISPIDYTLTNLTSGSVEETGTATSSSLSLYSFDIEDISENSSFELSLSDACGNTQTLTFSSESLPSPTTPSVSIRDTDSSDCLDNMAIQTLSAYGFQSEAKVILESGPTTATNTDEGFEYDLNLTYPDTIRHSSSNTSGSFYGFEINELPVGTYTFSVVDTCGNSVSDQFEILPEDVSQLFFEFEYTRDCLGNNTIDVNSNGVSADYRLYSFEAGYDESYHYWTITDDPTEYQFANLNPGSYTLQYERGSTNYNSPIVSDNGFHDCFNIDTLIDLLEYDDPQISSFNKILCDNSIYLELFVDSTKGIGPYEFEIFSGPQTFPRQANNFFEVTSEGTYSTRIFDDCGNARVRDISVENLVFEPLASTVSCSSANIIYPSSSYYYHEWTQPNGTTFIGDTLAISSIGILDTGIYIVEQHVTVNSCTDNFLDTFRLDMIRTSELDSTICPGTSILFGGESVSSIGTYVDSLLATDGCDSLVYLHLDQFDYNYGSTTTTICPGGSTTIEGINYTESGVFYDTLSTTSCDSVLEITINYSPYLRGEYSEQICEGSSTVIEGTTYDSPGVFYDTISNGSCDSIIEITIEEVAVIRTDEQNYFCEGESVVVRGVTYNTPGTYTLNISGSGVVCDSIITLTITEIPLPSFSLGNDTSICENTSITFEAPTGYVSYEWTTSTGTSNLSSYTTDISETIELSVTNNLGCVGTDIITITAINPQPLVSISNVDPICLGEDVELTAFGANTYLWTPGEIEGETITITPDETTVYSVIGYSNFQCSSEAEDVYVQVNTVPDIPLLTTSVYENCFIETPFTLSSNWGESFLWESPESTTDQFYTETPGNYTLQAWDENGCSATESFAIINKCVTVIAVPEAFSPNGDGLHDELEIKGKNFIDFEMRIFNRWGEVIFVTDDFNTLWNGEYRDEMMPIGSYPWVITYRSINTDLSSSEVQTLEGSISIIK